MPDGTYFNHPGVVITVAAGDDKAYVGGSSPSFPADLPDVVSVGGTDVTKQAGVWKSTVWNDSGAGCSTLFEAQPWQKEVPDWTQVGCGTKRSENDDAAVADPYTGVAVFDSTPYPSPEVPTGWITLGGTSVASPIMAADYALAGGSHGTPYPAQTLYSHLGNTSDFLDVTEGNDEGGKCRAPSLQCTAGPGYDGPTGVGSPVGLGGFLPGGEAQSVPVNT